MLAERRNSKASSDLPKKIETEKGKKGSWCENMGGGRLRERERGTRGARGESRGAFKIWLVEEAERAVR